MSGRNVAVRIDALQSLNQSLFECVVHHLNKDDAAQSLVQGLLNACRSTPSADPYGNSYPCQRRHASRLNRSARALSDTVFPLPRWPFRPRSTMLSRGTIPAPPNHTHSHLVLTEIGSERYCGEIDLADRHLDPWLFKAPNRFFRYTLCLWGDTEERRAKGLAHLAVTREHRRAKTDRLDTAMLMRVFLGWLRGKPGHCRMVAIPTLEEEDAKRPSRERESLVGERTRIINRMKGVLARLGIRGSRQSCGELPKN